MIVYVIVKVIEPVGRVESLRLDGDVIFPHLENKFIVEVATWLGKMGWQMCGINTHNSNETAYWFSKNITP